METDRKTISRFVSYCCKRYIWDNWHTFMMIIKRKWPIKRHIKWFFSIENYKRDDGSVCWIRAPCVSKIIFLLVALWNSSLTKTDLTITFLYISARTMKSAHTVQTRIYRLRTKTNRLLFIIFLENALKVRRGTEM